MYKFDTKVQHLKYKVLRTVAKHAWDSDFYETFLDIPKEIISGKTPTMRCCVYKERQARRWRGQEQPERH